MKTLFRTLIAFLILTPNVIFAQVRKPIDTKETVQKFNALMQLINYYYVEDVDQASLTEDAIISVLKELDPHSVYIPKKELQRVNEPLVGNFEGIGVQFQIYKDTILVISPVIGGPSEKLGIKAGDKIVKINGESAVGNKINNQYVFDKLRGPKGSVVVVSILRKGVADLIDYSIVRDKIPLNSIDAQYMITDDIGYIKLSRFARSSANEFQGAVINLKKLGMKNLIFDLRDNSGGYLDIAYELADQFLPDGKLVVYTQGTRSARQDFIATAKGVFEANKLIVLIDEGSASASEIVSGAVQDWDRGLIMGRRSFGKGLVQRQYMLPDSSAVRLTTAKYYTPSGRCIQKPYTEGRESYSQEISNRYKHGELIHADSIKFPDSLKYYTNNKRTVYGGGGIMPDLFIPMDTTFITKYYTDIFRKGLLNEYIVQLVDANRKDLIVKYPDFKAFKAKYKGEEKLMADFIDFAAKKDVPRNDADLAVSGKIIKTILKALLARNLFDMNAYFEMVAPNDDDLQKAVEAMHNDSRFKLLK